MRRTGPFLYLRLRRHDYTADEIAAWAARLDPFLDAGDDVFVFFRHDEAGRGPELAAELAAALEANSPIAVRRIASSGRSGAVALGRSEHDEELESLGDVVEAMGDVRGDEHE